MKLAVLARINGMDTPITIIARDLERAANIYAQWFVHHHGARKSGRDMLDMRVLTDGYVCAQPNMQDLMEAGHEGVCYWLEEAQVWNIASPTADMVGQLERPMEIQGFAFHDEGEEPVWVFAHDLAEAHAVYDIWHREEWGSPAEWDCIRRISQADIPMGRMTLLEDMATDAVGIAAETDDGTWRICSPEKD